MSGPIPKNAFGIVPQFDRDARPGEDFTFLIKAEDIGNRDDPEHCIFARCAKRTMRTGEAWFGRSTAYIRVGDEIVRFLYPPKTQAAIRTFDDTGEMQAGPYRVSVPRASQTVVGRRERNATNPRRKARKPGSQAHARPRGAWHAPRGWGRGVENV